MFVKGFSLRTISPPVSLSRTLCHIATMSTRDIVDNYVYGGCDNHLHLDSVQKEQGLLVRGNHEIMGFAGFLVSVMWPKCLSHLFCGSMCLFCQFMGSIAFIQQNGPGAHKFMEFVMLSIFNDLDKVQTKIRVFATTSSPAIFQSTNPAI